ncbi:MAG: aminotransferase class V-fold PLP-dependent enzyme [Desulfuromonadia bacterium]
MKFPTELIHGPIDHDPSTGAVSVPIYQTSTFAQRSFDTPGRYDYTRSGNPTREALEETIRTLEGGASCAAFSSGMAAICSTLLLFSPGDHLIISDDVYGGTFRAVTRLFSRWGLKATFVDSTDPADVAAAIRPETRGIYVETPSNPLLRITDLDAVVSIAREHRLVTMIDNTFMTPYLQQPIRHGFDIVIHSGTKFLNGHSDVVCGFAIARDEETGRRLRFIQNCFGAILSPHESWLVLRGVRTLKVRMEQSQQSARQIAQWLVGHPRVRAVYYPGLDDHPGREIHLRQASGAGGVLSFELESLETTRRVCEGIGLAAFAVSLGGVESILSHPATMSHAAMPAEERMRRGIGDTLLRLSVGLEDPEDLIEELDRLLG